MLGGFEETAYLESFSGRVAIDTRELGTGLNRSRPSLFSLGRFVSRVAPCGGPTRQSVMAWLPCRVFDMGRANSGAQRLGDAQAVASVVVPRDRAQMLCRSSV